MSGQRTRDRRWLLEAIDLSRASPRLTSAYAVGAIIVDEHGDELARAHSREIDPANHAEEAALAKAIAAGGSLAGATIYTSLEPCSSRKSRPHTCTQLILGAGITRVVFAMREPPIFVDGHGAELLRAAGVEVVEVSDLADLVREVNANLFQPGSPRR